MSEFDAARRAALMQDLLSAARGRPADLLPFADVKESLRLTSLVDRGVQEVPLSRIVGTLGRAREFNRAFLPRDEALRERWDDVRDLAEGPKGFPPVELYRVGDVDFVVDGHHRVSVARSLGAATIEARVREFPSPVSLGPEARLEDVLASEGLARFLETTGLAGGEDDYRVTEADGWERLLLHIETHRCFRGIDLRRPVSWAEAVSSWRDTVYRPMIGAIRRSGILADFPGRTETDLYLFTMDHLHYLREKYGHAEPARAVAHFRLRERAKRRLESRLRRFWRRLRRR